MKRNILSVVSVLMAIFLVSACAPQQAAAEPASQPENPVQGGAVEDLNSLMEALRFAGAQVELGETIEQVFFAVKGQIIKVNGQDVQVFVYESEEAMETDAAQISPDGGTVGTSMITWVATPHFFKSGRVLVLYVGDDAALLNLLKGIFGEQFAGR